MAISVKWCPSGDVPKDSSQTFQELFVRISDVKHKY